MVTPLSKNSIFVNIPQRKISFALEQTIRECDVCSKNGAKLDNACDKCRNINAVLRRYIEANIPVMYWRIDMKKHFKGEKYVMDKYSEIVSDLSKCYNDGLCICFSGTHGVGKTLITTNILKRAVEKGFNSIYVTLSDVVENIISFTHEQRMTARQKLLEADFLAIDEFDSRHMGTDAASDLYGRILENVFRTRVQNKLPIIMCTNSPNVIESFSGSLKQSIESLMNYTETIPIIGKDFRKTQNGDK
jgi:DNA replication protein DnaC